jgi:DNA polymerase-3 subunit delta
MFWSDFMDLVYLLHGEEEFLIDRQYRKLLKEFAEETQDGFMTYDCLEVPVQRVIEDCETIPFFTERKVVVVKNPIFLTGKKAKLDFEHNLDDFVRYINNPNPQTILIIIANYDSLDKRKKAYKALKKNASMFEAKPLDQHEVVHHIIKIFKKKNKEISKDLAKMIFNRVGNHFSLIYKEVQKIIIYMDKETVVTEDMVSALVGKTFDQNVFDLVNAVLDKNIKKSLSIYYDLIQMNESPIKIMVILANQFRLIYQTKQLYLRGLSESNIAKKLQVHPYAVKKAGERIRRYPEKDLLKILYQLSEIDLNVKRGKINQEFALEQFFLSLS